MTALAQAFDLSDVDPKVSLFGHHAPPACPNCKAVTWDDEGVCIVCGEGKPEVMLGELWPTLTAAQIKAQNQSAYRVKGIFPERGVGMIYGASGSGKSFLAFHLLGHIAVGADWFGYRTKPARCYYMGLEGFSGLGKRLELYGRTYGSECEPFLRFNDGAQWSLMDANHVQTIAETMIANGMRGGVLVIDTMSQAMAGHEENDAASMTAALKSCWEISRAIEGLVLLVHHTGKDAQRGPRGSSAITANLDGLVMVECDGEARKFKVEKSKDGQAGQLHGFSLDVCELGNDEDGDPITSCVVVPGGVLKKTDTMPKPGTQARIAYDCLVDIQKVQPITPQTLTDGLGEFGVPEKLANLCDWKEACLKAGLIDPDSKDPAGALSKAMARVRKELEPKGLLGYYDGWVWAIIPGKP